MKNEYCEFCGKLIQMRVGVYLPPIKARIFDLIWRSGEEGISSEDILNTVWENPKERAMAVTVKAHVTQINYKIMEAGWKIRGTIPRGGYRLVKLSKRKMENVE